MHHLEETDTIPHKTAEQTTVPAIGEEGLKVPTEQYTTTMQQTADHLHNQVITNRDHPLHQVACTEDLLQPTVHLPPQIQPPVTKITDKIVIITTTPTRITGVSITGTMLQTLTTRTAEAAIAEAAVVQVLAAAEQHPAAAVEVLIEEGNKTNV